MSFTYKAFISYSHAEDSKLAAALHSALHRFAKPWYRLRAMRVFRDKTSMSANPALWPAIEHALGQSEWLLYFASPSATQSPWVQKEIEWWLTHRSVERLILCITGGELGWDATRGDFDWAMTTALPGSLRGAFHDEPLWVDLRQVRNTSPLSLRNADFRAALLDIAAPLHGKPKDVLDSDDLREHRKLKTIGGTALALIAMLSYGLYRIDQISRERKDTVISHELAGKAYLNLPNNPELSALLALAGIARRQTGLAEVAFRHALARLAPAASTSNAATPPGNPAPALSMAFSPDGKSLAVAFADGHASLIANPLHGDAGARPLSTPAPVTALAWSDEGTLFASLSTGGLVRWDRGSEVAPAMSAMRLAAPASQIVASLDGNVVYAVSNTGTLTVFDWRTGSKEEYRVGGNDAITAFAVHRSGHVAATGNSAGVVNLWQLPGGEKLGEFPMEEAVTALDFNRRGRSVLSDELLVAGDRHGNLHVVDVAEQIAGKRGDMPAIQLPTVAGGIAGIAFTGNGKCIAVAGASGELMLKEVNSWNTLTTIQGDNADGTSMLAIGAGRVYATAGTDGQVRVLESALCADKDDLCALAASLPLRALAPEERRRFVAGQRESDTEEPLPPRCVALIENVLGGRR